MSRDANDEYDGRSGNYGFLRTNCESSMQSLDEVFKLFTRERRRFALYYLEERRGPVTVEELAATIGDWETDSGRGEVPDDRFENVLLELKHEHLPKVAEVEFIEFDPDEGIVTMSGSPAEFDVILSVTEAIEQPRDDVIDIL